MKMPFGKHKDKELSTIKAEDKEYLEWMFGKLKSELKDTMTLIDAMETELA